jgi:hypothetical protein
MSENLRRDGNEVSREAGTIRCRQLTMYIAVPEGSWNLNILELNECGSNVEAPTSSLYAFLEIGLLLTFLALLAKAPTEPKAVADAVLGDITRREDMEEGRKAAMS